MSQENKARMRGRLRSTIVKESYSFGNTIPVCFWYFPALSL
jgi:hypothetical protein